MNPSSDPGTNPTLAALQTERERLADALREAQATVELRTRDWEHQVALNQLLLSRTIEGIAGSDAEGRITFLNAAAETMLGYSQAELIGKNGHDILHHTKPDHTPYPHDECPIERSLREGSTQRVELDVIWRKDGTSITVEYTSAPLLEEGRAIGALIFFRDLTEQKKLETAVQVRGDERYHELVNGLDAMVWEGDPYSLTITYMSPQTEYILGYTVEQWVTAPDFWETHLHPEDRAHIVELCRCAARRGEDHKLEYRMIAADGRTVWLSDVVRVAKDAEGKPVQLRGVMTDCTQRKLLEQERFEGLLREERALAEVKAIKELDRHKTEFVNAVSHELRTPLTAILGYVEFLEEQVGGPLTEAQIEYVREILRGVRRLERLVDDLLDFARIEAGTFSLNLAPTQLERHLSAIVSSFRPLALANGIQLTTAIPAHLPIAAVDAHRIEQVQSNLLHNALKFTPSGGTVSVRACAEDGTIRVEVVDTGIGIAEEDLPKLFRRFSQLPSGGAKGGTGLGLAISKAIVEAHGGRIGVESTPGKGSTFWFTLPAKSAD